jgi:hypothetical protein
MQVFNMPQRSEEWRKVKHGMVSGTSFKRLISSAWLSLQDQIVAERFSSFTLPEGLSNDAMQRGIDYEQHVVELYERLNFREVHQAGFCVSDIYKFLGYSPDGFVGFDGGIEIKCPNTSNHVQYIRHDKIPSEYLPQITTAFVVNEDLEWMDFISFDDRFKPLPMWVKRIERKELKNYDATIASVEKFGDSLQNELDKYSKQIQS